MLIRGLFRTLKLALEARIEKSIPIGHALVPWLIEHTALLLNIKSSGQDGLTPWARVRGRPFSQQILCYAEQVLYKLPSKGPLSQPYGNMGAQQFEGMFVGYNRRSITFTVITAEGKVEARSMTRLPVPNRWSADKLAKIGRGEICIARPFNVALAL